MLKQPHSWLPAAVAGGAAGLVNGFFGGGGGMVLVPLLLSRCKLDRRRAFANSVAIILPLCALSAGIYFAKCGPPCPIWWGGWPAAGWAENSSKRSPSSGSSGPLPC